MASNRVILRTPTHRGERPRPAEAGTIRRWRRKREPPRRLTIAEVLRWADAHHRRTGRWPSAAAGKVKGESFLTWSQIDGALRTGGRGLPKCGGLPAFLIERRSKRRTPRPPNDWSLSIALVKSWAREHYRRTGVWPSADSGQVFGQPRGINWRTVHNCLWFGLRGAPGGTTLARLLKKDKYPLRRIRRPRLTHALILKWADAHFKRTGQWPTSKSGVVRDSPSDTWGQVHAALSGGHRGLPGGEMLVSFLGRKRGVPHRIYNHEPLTIPKILKWADAFHARTGRWPVKDDGVIPDNPADTWLAVQSALRMGIRGLEPGQTLANLLVKHRGHRNSMALSRLTKKEILQWADAHHARTGSYPTRRSGPIPESPGDTWMHIDNSLAMQHRGLRGKITLAGLMAKERGTREIQHLPPLSEETILRWARRHHRKTGRWPTHRSGPVLGAPGEHWRAINGSLGKGRRGLPGGDSLLKLLLRRNGEAYDERRRVKAVRA